MMTYDRRKLNENILVVERGNDRFMINRVFPMELWWVSMLKMHLLLGATGMKQATSSKGTIKTY